MTASTFVTASGVEVPAVTAEQMREVDRIAVDETGPNLFQMMENAGRSLALTALERVGGGSIVVLAGTGGNGGGGICAARHLANRGLDVSLVLSDEKRLADVPKAQLDLYKGTMGHIAELIHLDGLTPRLIVDAIIGYSLSGRPRGPARDMIRWANASPAPVLSLDVPSGIDATNANAPGEHVIASQTMTLALPKTGLVGRAVGEVLLADLGIPAETHRRAGLEVSSAVFGETFIVPVRPLS